MAVARQPTEYERLVKLEEISSSIRKLKNEELNLVVLVDEFPDCKEQLEAIRKELANLENQANGIKKERAAQDELPKQPNKNSARLIQEKLAVNKSEAKEVIAATPLRTFSAEDLKKMTAHYDKLPPHLQSIMEAVAFDTSV